MEPPFHLFFVLAFVGDVWQLDSGRMRLTEGFLEAGVSGCGTGPKKLRGRSWKGQ
jgi:hypothetical protein